MNALVSKDYAVNTLELSKTELVNDLTWEALAQGGEVEEFDQFHVLLAVNDQYHNRRKPTDPAPRFLGAVKEAMKLVYHAAKKDCEPELWEAYVKMLRNSWK
jgi:hypothetical protein